MRKSLKSGICFFLVTALVLTSLSAVMGNILPHERYGIATLDGSAVADGGEITSWIYGVEYGDTTTFNGDGSFQIYTEGDDDSDTTCKYGGENGDLIYYILDGTYIANEISIFDSGAIEYADLAFTTTGQPSMDVKINELVPQPGDAGTQYVYLYEPTGAIDLTRWRLDTHGGYSVVLDTLDTQYHPDFPNILYVDLGVTDALGTGAGHLMLSWLGDGGIAENNWVALDRVEYGDQGVQPDNTIHPEYPTAPGVGEGLVRDPWGQDTDDSSVDFTIAAETGRPTIDYEVVTGIWVEKSGADLIVHWDDVGMASYDVYYSTNQYADLGTWTLADTVGTNQFTDTGALGGANFYYVLPTGADMDYVSSMAYCYERAFVDDAVQKLHYVSLPDIFNNIDLVSASDIVIDIEGHTGDGANVNIIRVVKWDYTIRGYTDQYYYSDFPAGWTGGTDFDIAPGDGIGIEVQTGADFSWNICGVDTEFGMSFVDDAVQKLHYISLPYSFFDYTDDGSLTASDIVTAIEGHTGDGANVNIIRVVKWDYTIRGYTEQYYYSDFPAGWTGGTDFTIEPGDGIGIEVQTGANFVWNMELVMPFVG